MNEPPSDLPREASTPRWRLWLSAISVLLAPLVVLGVVSLVFPPKPSPVGIQTCVLPNGTKLTLHQVTYGKRHNFRKDETDWLMRSNPIELERTTSDESALLWFYSETKAGHPVKFDGWHDAVAEDEFGHRTLAGENGGLSAVNLAEIRALEVKALRAPGGKFQLHFLDDAEQSIATFDVPSPFPAFESWTAEPLPTSKAIAEGVTLHLDGFDVQSIPSSRPDPLKRLPNLTSLKIAPQWRMSRDRKPFDDWEVVESWFRAPYGHSVLSRDCPLAPHEPAWEFGCWVRRLPHAELPADSVWELGEFAVPAIGEETSIRQSRAMVEYQVEVSGMKSYVSSEPAGSEIAESSNDLSLRWTWPRTTGVTSPPGVAYALIEVHLLDEQGELLERTDPQPPVPGEINSQWFRVPRSSKAVRLRVTRNPFYLVKFLVKPPQPASDSKP